MRYGTGLSLTGKYLGFDELESHEVFKKLQELKLIDDDGNLSDGGKRWVEDKLGKMGKGELIIIEKYFIEYFGMLPVSYEKD